MARTAVTIFGGLESDAIPVTGNECECVQSRFIELCGRCRRLKACRGMNKRLKLEVGRFLESVRVAWGARTEFLHPNR